MQAVTFLFHNLQSYFTSLTFTEQYVEQLNMKYFIVSFRAKVLFHLLNSMVKLPKEQMKKRCMQHLRQYSVTLLIIAWTLCHLLLNTRV